MVVNDATTTADRLSEGSCGFAYGSVIGATILTRNPTYPTDVLVVHEYGKPGWRTIRPVVRQMLSQTMPENLYGWAELREERSDFLFYNVFPEKKESCPVLVFRTTNRIFHTIHFK
jgi:hypothetical protein